MWWTPQLSLTSGKSRHLWFWDSSCCEMRQRSNSHWNGNISTRVFIVRLIVRQPFSFGCDLESTVQKRPAQSLIHLRNALISRNEALIDFNCVIPVPTIQLIQPCSHHKAPPNSGSLSPSHLSGCHASDSVRGPNAANCLSLWGAGQWSKEVAKRSFIEFISFVFKSHCIIRYTSNKATHSQLDSIFALSHELPLKLSLSAFIHQCPIPIPFHWKTHRPLDLAVLSGPKFQRADFWPNPTVATRARLGRRLARCSWKQPAQLLVNVEESWSFLL